MRGVPNPTPVGGFINGQWASQTIGICTEDNREGRDLGALSIKTFFGPDRPYARGQKDLYSRLLEQWGGAPEHLKEEFIRSGAAKEAGDDSEAELTNFVADAVWERLDADTLCDRAVIIAGDPDSCVESLKKHEAAGVDQVLITMQTETVPHDAVMKSIELFGKHVIPEFNDS